MSEYMGLHNQWLSRPADERFTSLIDLHAHCEIQHKNSAAKVLPNRAVTITPVIGANGESDHEGLQLVGPNGGTVELNNWSFNQLSQRAGAPAGFMRELPAELAADCLNWGLKHNRSVEDLGLLLTRTENAAAGSSIATLRAATGPAYGRVWNDSITSGLLRVVGDGVNGDWRVPGEFGKAVTVTKENTTLYAGDRNMYVFLADEKNKIEIPNRRNGKPGSMSRFFFVWNSEVGAETLGIGSGLFDYACCNRIVWGVEQFREVRIRHTSGAPWRWIEEAVPVIEAMKNSAASPIEAKLIAAQNKKIDDVDKFLAGRFTRPQVQGIKAAHLSDEGRPIETLWDATTGVTAYARGIQYQDDRVALEREGGKILALAA